MLNLLEKYAGSARLNFVKSTKGSTNSSVLKGNCLTHRVSFSKYISNFGDELTLAVSREYQLSVEFLEDLMSLVFRGMSTTIPILIRVPSARKWSVGLTRRLLQREQSKI
jgi:hypothetical protein